MAFVCTDPELARAVQALQLKIAIDGPAGAGKSTVGRAMADSLGCAYLDTGLMYRAVTWRALRNQVPVSDAGNLAAIAERTEFSLSGGDDQVLLIEGICPDRGLHGRAVDAAVSIAAAHPEVRQILVRRQRVFSAGRVIVMVGRDIGTVVLPDAEAKLWVTASLAERARRRRTERPDAIGQDESAVASLDERDALDSTRLVSPSLPASDATILETDELSEREVLAAALDVVRRAVQRRNAQRSEDGQG